MFETITSPFWFWTILGLLLIGAEFMVPGFWIIFFGLSAILTGILNIFFPGINQAYYIIFCSILGALLLLLSRKLFPDFFASKNNTDTSEKNIEADDVTGAIATVTEAITPQRPGKVDFRGSTWNATADHDIPVGTTVTVVSRKNLTLTVK